MPAPRSDRTPVDLDDAFAGISDLWRPRVVARMNGQEVKVARVQGTFVWHRHEVDELFWVTRGTLRIEFRDRTETLTAGRILVVPAGVEHRPVADAEVELVLIEPAGVVNTGDAPPSDLTAPLG